MTKNSLVTKTKIYLEIAFLINNNKSKTFFVRESNKEIKRNFCLIKITYEVTA